MSSGSGGFSVGGGGGIFHSGGHLMGVHVVTQSLTFVLGLSFVAESAFVAWRATQAGVPVLAR